ncbi:MAG: N-acetylneuraminate synthase, partial [FCB group bacterium]|nr:N-acetylneuraminate synthase [FCB group bacterium]
RTGIVFSSTAQNPSDLDFLFSIVDLPFVKVGSDDLTNLALMRHYARKQKPMIISAGMAFAYEIEDAVSTIREAGNEDITVLHCVSSYPADPTEINLKKIPIIRDAFGVKAGFSDHTVGSAAGIGAVCFGAKVIEKHFTLDTGLPGPDHWFSINPTELKKYVDDIRAIEQALGKPELRPTDKELGMRRIARRKIVAETDLNCGETLTIDKLTFKRTESENAIDPKNVEFLVGRRQIKDVMANDSITLSLLE